MTHKDIHFKWEDKCEEAFQTLKTCLSESLGISYHHETNPIIMYTSSVGVS